MLQVVTSAPNINIASTTLKDGHTPTATAATTMDLDPAVNNDRDRTSTSPQNESSFPTSQSTSSNPPPTTQTTQTTQITEPTPVLDRPRHNDGEAEEPPADESQKAQEPTPASALSANLITLFDLDPLASTVARFDPKSGEKINKLRKSYENYLKAFSLAGKNKAVKHEDAIATGGPASAGMMGLSEMAAWPDEEWIVQKVQGKDVQKGLPAEAKSSLEKAFNLNPGKVPESLKWDEILGIEKAAALPPAKTPKGVQGSATVPNGVSPSLSNAVAATADPNKGIRTTRGVKRGYNERDYEGYRESFEKEEMENEGYESGETHGSRNSRGSKGDRKRRKTQEFGKTQRKESFVQAYGR